MLIVLSFHGFYEISELVSPKVVDKHTALRYRIFFLFKIDKLRMGSSNLKLFHQVPAVSGSSGLRNARRFSHSNHPEVLLSEKHLHQAGEQLHHLVTGERSLDLHPLLHDTLPCPDPDIHSWLLASHEVGLGAVSLHSHRLHVCRYLCQELCILPADSPHPCHHAMETMRYSTITLVMIQYHHSSHSR